MFPWVFGFTWQTGNLIFLGIFYSVVVVIFSTFVIATKRAAKNIESNEVDELSWHDAFADLPASAKVCRHVINGELQHRTCPNGFDCRICELHPELVLENAMNVARENKPIVSFPTKTFGNDITF